MWYNIVTTEKGFHMFELYSKKQEKIVDVYDVSKNKNGSLVFLVYIDGNWVYDLATNYEPL